VHCCTQPPLCFTAFCPADLSSPYQTSTTIGMPKQLADDTAQWGTIDSLLARTCGSNSSTCDLRDVVTKHRTVGAVQYAW
jgi:hypothetical protein